MQGDGMVGKLAQEEKRMNQSQKKIQYKTNKMQLSCK